MFPFDYVSMHITMPWCVLLQYGCDGNDDGDGDDDDDIGVYGHDNYDRDVSHKHEDDDDGDASQKITKRELGA